VLWRGLPECLTDRCCICRGSRPREMVDPLIKSLGAYCGVFRTIIWCLRKILRIPYTRHTANNTVRSITGCLPVSEKVKSFRLRFFGHLARSAPEEDHHRVIAAALRPPPDWRRPPGRPRSTWLRVIDEDIQPQNFGVHTAWRKAKDRDTWHQVVSTATLCYRSSPPRRRY